MRGTSFDGLRWLSLAIVIIGLLHLIAIINPITNDDAFVYYNYARNITEGRWFAYDVRNIPSEGFTSLFYLLLLTPFEALNINMTFASTVLNIGAMLGVVWVWGRLVRRAGLLSDRGIWAFYPAFWLLLIADRNLQASLEWGLETMFGPLIMAIAGLALQMTYGQASEQRTGLRLFFVCLFTAYLIRPESIAFVAGGATLLLILNPTLNRRAVFWYGMVFGVVFIAYHALKFLIFGDIVPTGFYRKVGGDGVAYVLSWFEIYYPHLILTACVTGFTFALMFRRQKWQVARQAWWVFYALITLFTFLFFLRTEPLIADGFRFLVMPIFLLYFILALGTVWILEHLSSNRRVLLVAIMGLAVLSVINLIGAIGRQSPLQALDLYARAENTTQAHRYLQFGYHLRENLPDPDAVTLVFGDAGAIPYALGGRFIDLNGLTEPPLARLARLPDSDEKTQQYTQYILEQSPDIVVLAWGSAPDGMWETPVSTHSPFREALPIELYEGYQEYGIVYVCSIRLYYEVHIGVWRNSPHYEPLLAALMPYCTEHGYIIHPNGLTVTRQGESVLFTGVN